MQTIPVANLALAFLPVAAVAVVLWRWSIGCRTLLWASLRMLVQLLAIGYVLTFVFTTHEPAVVAVVLGVMLAASSWIALRPLGSVRSRHYVAALSAIGGACLATLALIVLAVLSPQPWYEPRVVIPIAGMIFSGAMNAVSLAAERLAASLERGLDYGRARSEALNAALIPLLNAFFAVGLVALPGMMTGQILSGVDPQVAVRYQIMVMCMSFGAAGLAAIAYLLLARPRSG